LCWCFIERMLCMLLLFVVRYWDTLLEMFYPRFEFILLQNVQSIRECEPQRLGHIDVRPHYVCFSLSLVIAIVIVIVIVIVMRVSVSVSLRGLVTLTSDHTTYVSLSRHCHCHCHCHCHESIRECEPQRLGHIDVRPHYLCFSLSSLSLSLSLS